MSSTLPPWSTAAAVLGWGLERLAARHPAVTVIATAAATWTVLGGRSLDREAMIISGQLAADDLDAARHRVRNLVGRETAGLSADEVARATVESLAENTSDAVVAPLFWGAVAGIPGLLGYRAVNTLDAMIGHRSPRYLRFGWAAARLDDVVNWLPARLAALAAAGAAPLAGGSTRETLRIVVRDAGRHPSPNAGVVEAAFAGALGVRLGGRNVYHGEAEDRGVLGDGRPVGAADIAPCHPVGRRRLGRGDGRRGPAARVAAMTILILGGTSEARELAAALVASGADVISSLAGRVSRPALPAGRVRVGGFGGVDGLVDYLRAGKITAVVDATHPFAAQISANAAAATALAGVPLLRLERPGWRDHPQAGSWTWVADAAAARAAAEAARRPFLTTGRQSLEAFLPWADRRAIVRVVDPPEFSRAGRVDRDHLARPVLIRQRAAADDRPCGRCADHQGLRRGSDEGQARRRRRPRRTGGDHQPPGSGPRRAERRPGRRPP